MTSLTIFNTHIHFLDCANLPSSTAPQSVSGLTADEPQQRSVTLTQFVFHPTVFQVLIVTQVCLNNPLFNFPSEVSVAEACDGKLPKDVFDYALSSMHITAFM